MIIIAENKKTLVEITEEEFVDTIKNTLDSYDDSINDLLKEQQTVFKLFRDYSFEKQKGSDMTFFLENNEILFYKKTPRKKIGYK